MAKMDAKREVCALVNIDQHETIKLSLIPGDIYWQVQNLHVYEKHFNLVE